MANLISTNLSETMTLTFVSPSVILQFAPPLANVDDLAFVGQGVDQDDGGTVNDTLNTTVWGGNYTINLTTSLTNHIGEFFVGFENLVVGAGNDSLNGTSGANPIEAGYGNGTSPRPMAMMCSMWALMSRWPMAAMGSTT